MPIYWIFIMIAVAVALFSDVIDKKVAANGKLKKVIITFCVGIAVVLSIVIKIAL